MALPKILKTLDEKLDRILEILETPVSDPVPTTGIDPAQIAAWLDYDSYAAHEIIARIPSLPTEQREALRDYELANKARKSVLEALTD